MNVVLDTNVFVSGIHWSGASEKILMAVLRSNLYEAVHRKLKIETFLYYMYLL